ncbi:hypothetical protein BV25DRAFT_1861759 [Artomyces pyxidatus]|uniref:Uncharacterized protein n=1 Tax=Artomyces pyxidatus TaxID=48021 RepID=A0ACB8SRT7_9AGAM|nr:hypothetical protein BV25DRAFT_1861759 [Artomyces pyxidatus]
MTVTKSTYPNSGEAAIIRAAEALMVETMSKFSDPSHDHFHVRRVRKTALHLARTVADVGETQPDMLTVELGALLHDVLDKKYVSTETYADPESYFLPFFQSLRDVAPGIDLLADGRAKEITRIVENVSWSNEKKLRKEGKWGEWHERCVELHCVQDADRLDAIGAFGILRCAAYTAARNHALYAPESHPAQPTSAIQHFHDKLVHIHERMKTAPGKQMAEKRHKIILEFIAAIDDEYDPEQQSIS